MSILAKVGQYKLLIALLLLCFFLIVSNSSEASRKMIATMGYVGYGPCTISAAVLGVKNMSDEDQTFRVKGGHFPLLGSEYATEYSTYGIGNGLFNSRFIVRGSKGLTTLSTGAATVGGGGKLVTQTATPAVADRVRLTAGGVAFFQAELARNGGHGLLEIEIEVEEDTGAISAGGYLMTRPRDNYSCTNASSVGSNVTSAIVINGSRPF